MPIPPEPDLDLRLERAAPRARRLLGPAPAGGFESTQESGGPRRGLPDDKDASGIAAKLRATATEAPGGSASRDPMAEADALALTLVSRARAAMLKLLAGAADGALPGAELMALEAVMHTRGRPPLRVENGRMEALDPVRHPGSDIWRTFLDDHEEALLAAAGSTGAICVKDRLTSRGPWVQGTAWVVGGDRVVTNRHVLLPGMGGTRLVQRLPGQPTEARLRAHLDVRVDFTFDNSGSSPLSFEVAEVLYVAEANDPLDVAVLRLAVPSAGHMPKRITLMRERLDADHLYVVGHPGKLDPALVPENVQAVFGSPDERKRISPGEQLDPDPAHPADFVHDASTIGGYSGGSVFGFLEQNAGALHYCGHPTAGNRAVLTSELLQAPVARFLVAEG
jgi:hypothetical protein